MEHRRSTGSILGFPGATDLEHNAAALELDCEILIPAALENQITKENAPRLKAKIIAEGANGPMTAEASAMLSEAGVLILPDAFANAGGVTVSYFEWLKNLQHVRFGRMEKRFEETAFRQLVRAIEKATGTTFSANDLAALAKGPDELDLVNSGLEQTMIEAYHEIREIHKRSDGAADLRTASFISAIDKIATSYKDLGIFP